MQDLFGTEYIVGMQWFMLLLLLLLCICGCGLVRRQLGFPPTVVHDTRYLSFHCTMSNTDLPALSHTHMYTYTHTHTAAAKKGNLGSWFTSTKMFRRVTSWAFKVCDSNKTGTINQAELYAGVLLVHVTLAKYAGSAACYPPTREKVDELFVTADQDKSGDIDEKEFDYIMVILFNQIAGRICMYYGFLIVIAPYLGSFILHILTRLGVGKGILFVDEAFDNTAPNFLVSLIDKIPDTIWERMPAQIISLLIFFFVIPTALNKLDEFSYKAAKSSGVDLSDDAVDAAKKEE